jgi:hypothetical protein
LTNEIRTIASATTHAAPMRKFFFSLSVVTIESNAGTSEVEEVIRNSRTYPQKWLKAETRPNHTMTILDPDKKRAVESTSESPTKPG